MFVVIFIYRNIFLRIAGKTTKIAKIRKPQKFRTTRQSPIQYSAMFFFEVIVCALDDISNNRL